MIHIVKASLEHVQMIAPLFDDYRVFYKQPSDIDAATSFLKDRINKDQSVIYLAFYNEKPAGFTQLYPTFSSVSLEPSLILNDLYVDKIYRKEGVGASLLNKAKQHCRSNNYKGLALETAVSNPAQKLYEKLGWEKDSHCFHYFWTSTD